MRVQDGEEEDAHPGPGAARVQRDEGHAHGLVEGDERHHDHDEGPEALPARPHGPERGPVVFAGRGLGPTR